MVSGLFVFQKFVNKNCFFQNLMRRRRRQQAPQRLRPRLNAQLLPQNHQHLLLRLPLSSNHCQKCRRRQHANTMCRCYRQRRLVLPSLKNMSIMRMNTWKRMIVLGYQVPGHRWSPHNIPITIHRHRTINIQLPYHPTTISSLTIVLYPHKALNRVNSTRTSRFRATLTPAR